MTMGDYRHRPSTRSPPHRHHHSRHRPRSPSPSHRRRRSRTSSPPPSYDPDRRRRRERRSPSPHYSPDSRSRPHQPHKNQRRSRSPFRRPLSPPPAPPPKQTPNYAPTGLLAREANTRVLPSGSTTQLKYHEPPEARLPPPQQAWRLYVFSADSAGAADDDPVMLPLATRSCWLLGRDAGVADHVCRGPGIDKQHAVLQFRETAGRGGGKGGAKVVRPYVLDLESRRGTWLNKEILEAGRFVEVRGGDVLRLGDDETELVVMLPPEGLE